MFAIKQVLCLWNSVRSDLASCVEKKEMRDMASFFHTASIPSESGQGQFLRIAFRHRLARMFLKRAYIISFLTASCAPSYQSTHQLNGPNSVGYSNG